MANARLFSSSDEVAVSQTFQLTLELPTPASNVSFDIAFDKNTFQFLENDVSTALANHTVTTEPTVIHFNGSGGPPTRQFTFGFKAIRSSAGSAMRARNIVADGTTYNIVLYDITVMPVPIHYSKTQHMKG